MCEHETHVYPQDGAGPCFATCVCGLLVHCPDHSTADITVREHLEAVETDRGQILRIQVRRDLLRLTDALELVAAIRRAIDLAQNELNDLGKGAA